MVIFHKNLEVYRLILEFIRLAAEIIKHIPSGQSHLSDQLRRASTSMGNLSISPGKTRKRSRSQRSGSRSRLPFPFPGSLFPRVHCQPLALSEVGARRHFCSNCMVVVGEHNFFRTKHFVVDTCLAKNRAVSLLRRHCLKHLVGHAHAVLEPRLHCDP